MSDSLANYIEADIGEAWRKCQCSQWMQSGRESRTKADYGLIVEISALCSANLWRLIMLDSIMFGLEIRLEETPFILNPI